MASKSELVRNMDQEQVGKRGRWEDMNHEILAMIFAKIVPVDEMVRTVSLVSKGWTEAMAEPHCWTDIDLKQWCSSLLQPFIFPRSHGLIDSVVCRLVQRSNCSFTRLSALGLSDLAFHEIALRGRCLKVLEVPKSHITNEIVEEHAKSLVNLTELDISFCFQITCKGVKAFGKHCKNLVHLKRNMWADDSEAFAIAETMSGLSHLELKSGRFGNKGLKAILINCAALTHLDIQDCLNVRLRDDYQSRCGRLTLVYNGPFNDYEYDEYEPLSSRDADGYESCGSF